MIQATTLADRKESNRVKFLTLVERGFVQPDYLAREVWPEVYEAMPALAITEANAMLTKYRAGELGTITNSKFPVPVPDDDDPPLDSNDGGPQTMAKKKKSKTVKAIGVPSENTTSVSEEPPKQAASARKPREPKLKQSSIPGMEPETYPDIDRAAGKYSTVRDERMELTDQEVKLQVKLLGLMREHGLTQYKYDGRIVEVIDGDAKVKVKKEKVPAVD